MNLSTEVVVFGCYIDCFFTTLTNAIHLLMHKDSK